MTLAELQAALQALGYTTDTAAQQTIFLNSSYRYVCGLQRWPFLEKQDTSITTTAGTAGYALSAIADLRSVDAVRIEQTAAQVYYDLENKEPQDFRDYEHLDRDTAPPSYWTQINQELRFFPVPDDAYTVRMDYIMTPPDLVNPTDVPVMPTEYHDILVFGAGSLIAYRERDWLGRQFLQGEMGARLQAMKDEYLLRQRQTSSHVKKHREAPGQGPPYPYGFMGWD